MESKQEIIDLINQLPNHLSLRRNSNAFDDERFAIWNHYTDAVITYTKSECPIKTLKLLIELMEES